MRPPGLNESVAWVACGGSHTAALVRLGRLDEDVDDAQSTERSSEAGSFKSSFNANAWEADSSF